MADPVQVFISCGADLRPKAEELAAVLERQGVKVITDTDVPRGRRWRVQIQRLLDDVQSVVFLLAPDGQLTPWLEMEWEAALVRTWSDPQTRFLPVVFGQADVPPFLKNWRALYVSSSEDVRTWTEQVLEALRGAPELDQDSIVSNQRERETRLEQLRHAAAELWKDNPEAPAARF